MHQNSSKNRLRHEKELFQAVDLRVNSSRQECLSVLDFAEHQHDDSVEWHEANEDAVNDAFESCKISNREFLNS